MQLVPWLFIRQHQLISLLHTHLESYSFIGFRSKENVLIVAINSLYTLFIAGHESMARNDVHANFRVVHLQQGEPFAIELKDIGKETVPKKKEKNLKKQ